MPQPLYYRFAVNDDGEAMLSHNHEDLPSHVRYHSDLAQEGGKYHGYAYRIKGGWRLTDWEHRPVEDPFVTAQVIRAIRKEEGAHLPHEDKWEVVPEPSFDKMHYGLPVEKGQAA